MLGSGCGCYTKWTEFSDSYFNRFDKHFDKTSAHIYPTVLFILDTTIRKNSSRPRFHITYYQPVYRRRNWNWSWGPFLHPLRSSYHFFMLHLFPPAQTPTSSSRIDGPTRTLTHLEPQ